MKKGDVYDYETGELICRGTDDEAEKKDHSGLLVVLYVLGGIAKVLGIVILGVFSFAFTVLKGLSK